MKSLPRLLPFRFHSPTSLHQPIRTTTTTTSAPTLSIAKGQDATEITQSLKPLLRYAGGRWSLLSSGKGVHAEFQFKGFNRTWEFMNKVAEQCKVDNHHPEWSNVYNKTQITWTTHRPEGLTMKDIRMARFCDEAAREFGEITTS